TFVIVALATGEPIVSQLITPHMPEPVVASQEPYGWRSLGSLLVQDKPLVIFAIIGSVTILAGSWRGVHLVPVLWCGIALLFFGFHRPLWYHHLLMALVPMAWLTGIAARVGFDRQSAIWPGAWPQRVCATALGVIMIAVVAVWNVPRFGTSTDIAN